MKKMITIILVFVLILPASVLADPDSPLGRWTITSTYNELVDGYMLAKTDLIFFDDGNVFRFSVTKKRLDNDITISHDSGIWVGNSENMVIRFNNKTFTARIDEDDFLHLVNDDIDNKFIRIRYVEDDK